MAPTPKPPPPPAPPPNPPTYASASRGAPIQNMGRFGPLGDTILTGPLGAPESGTTQRKSLLGQ